MLSNNNHVLTDRIRQHLRTLVSLTQERATAYYQMKKGAYAEHDKFLGVRVPHLRTYLKEILTMQICVEDIESLLYSPYNEERLLALLWLVSVYDKAAKQQSLENISPALRTSQAIFNFYLQHKGCVNNWNLVDASAHLIVGRHLYHQPHTLLFELADSPCLWDRRIAMVATWYFIKQKDVETTYKLALTFFKDPHHLMHKATGWMLREAGKIDEEKLVTFLIQYKSELSSLTKSYATERLEKHTKEKIYR